MISSISSGQNYGGKTNHKQEKKNTDFSESNNDGYFTVLNNEISVGNLKFYTFLNENLKIFKEHITILLKSQGLRFTLRTVIK